MTASRTLGVWISCVAACLVGGCMTVDADRCGPHMRYAAEIGVCVCADHAIASGGGCAECAEDEVVTGASCGCAPGEAKNVDMVCASIQGLGAPCDASTACASAIDNVCSVRGGIGTCTRRCAGDAECEAAYVCADWEPQPSCRLFSGHGAICAAPADCAGLDAALCLQGHCVVQGCTVGTDDCPGDTGCCDFSMYGLGTLCAPAGSCS